MPQQVFSRHFKLKQVQSTAFKSDLVNTPLRTVTGGIATVHIPTGKFCELQKSVFYG